MRKTEFYKDSTCGIDHQLVHVGKTAILFSDLKVSECEEESYSLFTAKRSAFPSLEGRGSAEEKQGRAA